MSHKSRLLTAACFISLASVAAFAPDTGSGSGSAKPAKDAKAPPVGDPAAPPPGPELAPEVTEQLELAAANLTTANARITELEGQLADERRAGSDLSTRLNSVERELKQAHRDLAAAQAKSTVRELEPAVAAEEPRSVRVNVLKGTVHHPHAVDGKASEGGGFVTTLTEAMELTALADRGVVSFERLDA